MLGCRWPGWKWTASSEEIRLIFSKFIVYVLENSLKLRLWFIFSSKIRGFALFEKNGLQAVNSMNSRSIRDEGGRGVIAFI